MKSDTQLKDEVLVELEWDPAVCSKDISVIAKNGVVTLNGSVPHYADKRAAERAAQRVEGVKAIAEEMEVNPSGVHKRPDSDIAQTVVNALAWHVWVPDSVKATVENGRVSLTGSVRWEFERKAAEDSVTFLSGVKGVTNEITIEPSVEVSAVKNSIEKALKRDAEIDAKHIKVTTLGGKVFLTGMIHSWNEREEAAVAAWRAPGVTAVQNDLVVSY